MTDFLKVLLILACLYALVGPTFRDAIRESFGTRILLGLMIAFLTLSLL